MKRVHESVDYIKHRHSKQMYNLSEQLGNVELKQDSLVDSVHSVSIPLFRTIREENGTKFTAYVVRVHSGQTAWEVSRRYNDFYRLHEGLLSDGFGYALPAVPPKKVFGAFSKDFLQQRRAELEHYLRTLVASSSCLQIPQLRSFLFKGHVIVALNAGNVAAGAGSLGQLSSGLVGERSNNSMNSSISVSGERDLRCDDEHLKRVGDILDFPGNGSNVEQDDSDMEVEDNSMRPPQPLNFAGVTAGDGGVSIGSVEIGNDEDDHLDAAVDNTFRQEDIATPLLSTFQFPVTPSSIGGMLNDNSIGRISGIEGSSSSTGDENMKKNGIKEGRPPKHPNSVKPRADNSGKKKKSTKPKLDDFEMVRVLGKGSFGKVVLCRKRDNGKLYAMKVLKKQHVIKRKQVAHTRTERSVLGLVDHPFVVKLHYAFQTENKLHFVLDFCSGGELFFHLGRAGRFSEHLGRFYSAEIALALGHLHNKGVVYRDLKPENILLDSDGHIKLADFGLSKEGINESVKGTHSFCGTPEYLAPEVLNRTGHGSAVDWWSLGALLYEMLTGLPPWYSQDRQKMFTCIRSSELRFPEYISAMARLILADFLERDVTKRLGSNGDIAQVKQHPFFAPLEWDRLYNKEIPSPFVPRLNSQTDTGNFDTQFTRLPINSIDTPNLSLSPQQPHALAASLSSSMPREQPLFDGFTFVEQSNLVQQMNAQRVRQQGAPGNANSISASPTLTSALMFEL